MRPPQQLLESQFFTLSSVEELLSSVEPHVSPWEASEIARISEQRLPPITSVDTLSAMLGINPGLLWSFANRTERYYRSFRIPKGSSFREITAPRVALKLIQKWISIHLQRTFTPPDHVYGFVPGRSHIQAAVVHRSATWLYSVDIASFFATTPERCVYESLLQAGYEDNGAGLIAKLCCLRGNLPQGSPASPILSNMVFLPFDKVLKEIATAFCCRLTRYADDIVFSGVSEFNESLPGQIDYVFRGTPWTLSRQKTRLASLPQRLKVHGLLVHGERVRLTKGYRNRLRAFRHLLERGNVPPNDARIMKGHINYQRSVDFPNNACD